MSAVRGRDDRFRKFVSWRALPQQHRIKTHNCPVQGIDRELLEQMLIYNGRTEMFIYTDMTSTASSYRAGMRPELDKAVDRICRHVKSHRDCAIRLLKFVRKDTPRVCWSNNPIPSDRNLTDEQMLHTDYLWCNEQARLFCALAQVAGIPSRIVFLFSMKSPFPQHTVSEVFIEGRWVFADVLIGSLLIGQSGQLYSAADVHHLYEAKKCFNEYYKQSDAVLSGLYKRPQKADMCDVLGFVNYRIGRCSTAEPLRFSNFEYRILHRFWRMNSPPELPEGSFNSVGLYAQVPNRNFPKGAGGFATEKTRFEPDRRATDTINQIKQHGCQVFIATNQPAFGAERFGKPTPAIVEYFRRFPQYRLVPCHNPSGTSICPSHPALWKMMRANLNDIFELYPAADGLILTTGDNGADIFCQCKSCRNYPFAGRLRDFLETAYSVVNKGYPRRKLIMRMHNIGDWYRYNPGFDLEKVIADVPEDILFAAKLHCPPAFDCSLNAPLSIWIDKIPDRLIVALGMDNANQSPNDFLLTGAFDRMARMVQLCKDAGIRGIGFSVPQKWWGLPLLQILNALSNPGEFENTEKTIADWAEKYFGKKAGGLVTKTMLRSEQVTNKINPAPYFINTRNQMAEWNRFSCLRAPYFERPTDTNGKSLMKILCGTETPSRKIVDGAIESMDVSKLIAQSNTELKKARSLASKNRTQIDRMLTLNSETLHYSDAYRNYIAAYLLYRLSNKQFQQGLVESARKANADAFFHLLKALNAVHYYVGDQDSFAFFTYYYYQNINRELDRFDWSNLAKPVLSRIQTGRTLLLFSDDIPRRDNEGRFLEKLLGLKKSGTKLIADSERPLYRWKADKRAGQIWYDDLEILLSKYGSGWIAYASLEEAKLNSNVTLHSPPIPQLKIKQKATLQSVLTEIGLSKGARPVMNRFERLTGQLYWHGPLYNPGNYLETVRFYKLLPSDHFGWIRDDSD